MSEQRTNDQDEYRVQTEEDLNSVPPMSRMQKIVLAGAAVLVIAAVFLIWIEPTLS